MKFLLDRKHLCVCVALVIGVLMLSSCAAFAPRLDLGRPSAGYLTAVSQGVLRPSDAVVVDVVELQTFEIITAQLGSLYTTFGVPISFFYNTSEHMYFSRGGGLFTLYAENGQIVREGDVLAHLSMQSEALEIDRVEAVWRLDRFERSIENDTRWLDVENARLELAIADEANWQQQALRLAQAELRYERFRYDTANTRQGLQQAIDNIDYLLAGEYILAPFDGMVLTTQAIRIQNNQNMTGRPRILTIVDENDFRFAINLTAASFLPTSHGSQVGYRNNITVRSLLPAEDGEGPLLQLETRVVSDPWGAGERGNLMYWLEPLDLDTFLEDLYRIDPYTPMFTLNNLNFAATIPVTLVDNGVLLPIAAVNPQDGRHFVYLYDDGRLTKLYVSTGVRFEGYVHIVSGLEPGVQVVILP